MKIGLTKPKKRNVKSNSLVPTSNKDKNVTTGSNKTTVKKRKSDAEMSNKDNKDSKENKDKKDNKNNNNVTDDETNKSNNKSAVSTKKLKKKENLLVFHFFFFLLFCFFFVWKNSTLIQSQTSPKKSTQ